MPALLGGWTAGKRDVGQINVAYSSALIPGKHRVNSLSKFCTARSIKAAGVYPEVLEVVLGSLLCAEVKLPVACFVCPCAVFQVRKSNFVIVQAPGMRQNGVAGNDGVTHELFQTVFASAITLQKAHRGQIR